MDRSPDLSDRSDDRAPYAPSSLPPAGARILAFLAILVGGGCGGLIGYGFTDLQCSGDCTVVAGGVGVLGAVIGAVGVGVVAVLALRAMGEWRTVESRNDR
jgi:hypothetical protein